MSCDVSVNDEYIKNCSVDMRVPSDAFSEPMHAQ